MMLFQIGYVKYLPILVIIMEKCFLFINFCLMTTVGVTIDVIKQYIETWGGKWMIKNIALKIRIYPNKKTIWKD